MILSENRFITERESKIIHCYLEKAAVFYKYFIPYEKEENASILYNSEQRRGELRICDKGVLGASVRMGRFLKQEVRDCPDCQISPLFFGFFF